MPSRPLVDCRCLTFMVSAHKCIWVHAALHLQHAISMQSCAGRLLPCRRLPDGLNGKQGRAAARCSRLCQGAGDPKCGFCKESVRATCSANSSLRCPSVWSRRPPKAPAMNNQPCHEPGWPTLDEQNMQDPCCWVKSQAAAGWLTNMLQLACAVQCTCHKNVQWKAEVASNAVLLWL